MDDCCICLDINNMDNNDTVYIINEENDKNVCCCNINLHSKCFFMWYKKNKTCPICRNIIKPESIYFNNEDDFIILNIINKEPPKLPIPSEDILDIVLEPPINQQPHRDINRNRRLYNPFYFISYFRST